MNIISSQILKQFPIKQGFYTKSYSNTDQILFPNQKHTDHIVLAEFFNDDDADAILSETIGQKIGIKTADCVPILIYEKNKHIVGAIHAGWIGTANQIIKKTVERILKMGGVQQSIFACLGPAIGECCYDIPAEREQYFDSMFLSHKHGKTFLNLKEANIQQLLDLRIPKENIESTFWCTSCNNDMFYSYRREKPLTRQNISYIELN